MKKLLSLIAALTVTLLCTVPAMAAGFTARISLRLNNDQPLQPNQEYRIPILAQYEDEPPTHLRAEDLGGRRFAVSLREGTDALYLPTVETDQGLCWLVVKTRPSYTTTSASAKVLLRLLEKDSPKEVSRTEASLRVASRQMSDQTVDALKASDSLPVENTAPVITEKQFQRISQQNSYRAVTLAGAGWEYTVGVGGLGTRNLYSTTATRPEFAMAYPGQPFVFLSFPGAPDFGAAGTMVIDVSETPEEFEGQYHLYRLLDDRLYYLRSDYDSEAGTLTFRPSQLGDYVITNRELEEPAASQASAGAAEAVRTAAPAQMPKEAASGDAASGNGNSAPPAASSGGASGGASAGSEASSGGSSGSSAAGQGEAALVADQNPSTGSQRTATAAVLGTAAMAIAAAITLRKR